MLQQAPAKAVAGCAQRQEKNFLPKLTLSNQKIDHSACCWQISDQVTAPLALDESTGQW